MPATFNDSGLSGHRGECPSPAGAEDKGRVKKSKNKMFIINF